VRRTDPSDSVRITIYMDELTADYRFAVNNVYYDFDRAEIKPTSMPAIDSLANFLRDNPALTVEIYSHADAKGTNEYNRELSLRRAESVLVALATAGIDRSRMIAKGLGEEQPAAPNTTTGGRDNPQGRALNRRTEFRVVSEDQGRRVIFDSTRPGSPNSQGDNLRIDESTNEDGENDSDSDSGRPGSRVNRDGISE